MDDYSQNAIELSARSSKAYCKFITANDVGLTGGHQSGFHIHKDSYNLLFEIEGAKGETKDRWVKIKWQDDFVTTSRFIYYGEKTRNEYRITNFGRGFPFLVDEMVGSLLVIGKVDQEFYKAYVLQTEEEIESFLDYFGISPSEANGIVKSIAAPAQDEKSLILNYVQKFGTEFPTTVKLSETARQISDLLTGVTYKNALENPDGVLSGWVNTEYRLFQELEKEIYKGYLNDKFTNVDSLVEVANTILNRRKSRAGKSLEHHLARIFDLNKLPYSEQKVTEGHKKPDFIIPSIELYRDSSYDSEKLIFLASKTTCKDRWRQVLNEAARTPNKHLFTLQPGISSNQLKEMKEENLTLVVPEKNKSSFPAAAREDIMSLKDFIAFAQDRIVI